MDWVCKILYGKDYEKYLNKPTKRRRKQFLETPQLALLLQGLFFVYCKVWEAFEKLDREIKKENDRTWNHKDLEARIFSNRERYKEIINKLTSSEKSVASRFRPLMDAWRVNYRISKGIYD